MSWIAIALTIRNDPITDVIIIKNYFNNGNAKITASPTIKTNKIV